MRDGWHTVGEAEVGDISTPPPICLPALHRHTASKTTNKRDITSTNILMMHVYKSISANVDPCLPACLFAWFHSLFLSTKRERRKQKKRTRETKGRPRQEHQEPSAVLSLTHHSEAPLVHYSYLYCNTTTTTPTHKSNPTQPINARN